MPTKRAPATFVDKTAEPGRKTINLKEVDAVVIASKRFECDIILAFRDGWLSQDKLPVFYASELPFLKDKSQDEMNQIVRVKQAMPGSVVRK